MAIKVGIIGMGKMGRIRKREMDKHHGFEVIALCDIYDGMEEEFPSLFCTKNWREVLEQDIDAVVVCTFNNVIAEIVEASLDKGYHVFSEKPPGKNMDDVKIMKSAHLRNPSLTLKYGFNHRYHYAVKEAKALIDSGKYGKIMWARGVYGKAGATDFESVWRSDLDLAGGGILLDQGIHMLDLMRYFLGDFTEVKSYIENMYWTGIPFEDNAFAMLKTDDNKVGMLHSSATQWKHKFLLELYLENGYININGLVTGSRSYGDESITFARKEFEDEWTAVGRPREQTIYFDRDDSWEFEIQDFYDCITGNIENVMCNIYDAENVMSTVEKIYIDGRKK